MRRFHSEQFGDVGTDIDLSAAERSHLFKTLRGRVGERVELLDGGGTIAIAEIEANQRLVIRDRTTTPEPKRKCHLFIAPPKRTAMDQLIRQCSEVGVWSITPMVSERSVSVPDSKGSGERWERILVEGCKQSGNPFFPEIHPRTTFPETVSQLETMNATVFFGCLGDAARSLRDLFVDDLIGQRGDVYWLVGPEGGFSGGEIESMRGGGFVGLDLGPWTMRSETAAVAGAVALVNALNGREGGDAQEND